MKDAYLLNNYIKQISKYPLLTADEELELSRQVLDEKNTAAEQRLVNSNLRLVVKISIELCKGNISIMDVIQNGNFGLIKAAGKFDYKRGVRFSTYAAFWIKQAILRGFIKPSMSINISFRKDELNKRIKNYVKEYFAEHNSFPTIEDITRTLNVKRKDALDVLLMIRSAGEVTVNNYNVDTNEEAVYNVQDNRYNPERVMEEILLNQEIIDAIDSFSQRESEIIRRRFGFDAQEVETLHNIGGRYDITAEATRQIEKKVLNSIKMRFPYLSYYLYA